MSSEWNRDEETEEDSDGCGKPDSPSSYFQSESSKAIGSDQKSEAKRNTMTVEVEVHCRRKRWARPPVVGGGSGSESEEPRVSPSSSLASLRPLEWDSGADVGYSCYPPGEGEEGVRREPEGRTRDGGDSTTKAAPIGPPTAESTPKATPPPPPLFPEVAALRSRGGGEALPSEESPAPSSQSAPLPTVRPSNSSSSVNTVVSNSEPQTLSRHQDLGARSESVEWVSVEGEAERGAELLGRLVEGRDPGLARAIISRVFERLLRASPGLDKATGTCRSLLVGADANNMVENAADSSASSVNNTKPSIEGESMPTDTSSEKRPCSSSSVSGGRRWERRTDWRRAATATERLRERQDTSSESVDDKKLAEIVNMERKTQLEWIKSEISHLSSLQKLLERHELLKKNVNKLKTQKSNRRITSILRSHPTSEQETGWSSHNYIDSDNSCRQPPPTRAEKGGPREDEAPGRVFGLTRHVVARAPDRAPPSLPVQTKSSTVAVQTSLPRTLSYDITFDPKDPTPLVASKKDITMVSLEELHAALDQILKPPSLQDNLLMHRPDVVKRAEERRRVVRELVGLREERAAKKREILIRGAEATSPLPPPPLAVKKAVSTADRRKRRYPKDKSKEEAKKKEEVHRTNRLMAQMFNRKLQARTLKGQLDLSNSTSVISSL